MQSPPASILIRSSDALGWGELRVREYIEPPYAELWPVPTAPILTVGLILRGVVHLEMRPINGAWQGQVVQAGSFFLQPDYLQPYEFRWQSCSAAPVEALYINLSQRVLLQLMHQSAQWEPKRVTFVEQIGFRDSLLLQLGLALQQELKQPMFGGPIYAQTAAQMLAIHLLRHHSTACPQVWQPPTHGLSSKQVARIRDFVHDQIENDLSLATLAQQVDLSTSYFARMFRLATGESPHQFVLRQRLERAQLLLQTTSTSIVDVAMACGFTNQSYLTTVFKRQLGITPQRYRRQLQ